jgi:hypothetical protein
MKTWKGKIVTKPEHQYHCFLTQGLAVHTDKSPMWMHINSNR